MNPSHRRSISLIAAVATLFVGFATIPASAASEDVNLLATYGSLKNSDGLIGLVGEDFNNASYTYSGPSFPVDTTVTNADINCDDGWNSVQFLCDPEPTTNVRGQLTQNDPNTGYTSDLNGPDSVSYLVIDLGAVSTFDSLEIYQMVGSDGNATSVSLDVSSAVGDTWPTESDESWSTLVDDGDLNDETALAGSGPYTNSAVTTLDFPAATGRYVKLSFKNDGSYANDNYIEVAGAKLFGHRSALAETGLDGVNVGVIGTIALVSIASGFVTRRRLRS